MAKGKGTRPDMKGNKYSVGNNGGRPTKFRSKYVEMLREFFSIEPYKKEVMEKTVEYFADGRVKRSSEKCDYIANKLPTLLGFAEMIETDYATVLKWANDGEDLILPKKIAKKDVSAFKEFFKTYKEAKVKQKEFLISLGLSGTAPPAAFIFTAKNITDMRDKTETDITSKGEQIKGIQYIIPKENK